VKKDLFLIAISLILVSFSRQEVGALFCDLTTYYEKMLPNIDGGIYNL
jgi:hypothetical protein